MQRHPVHPGPAQAGVIIWLLKDSPKNYCGVQEAARQRPPHRGRRQGGHARDPGCPAGGRRQLQDRQAVRRPVTERAVGSDVLESLTPAQMIVKIVNEELTNLMGSEAAKLNLSPKPPTVVMLGGPRTAQARPPTAPAGRLYEEAARQAPPSGGLRHLPSGGHHPVGSGGRPGGRPRLPVWDRLIPSTSPGRASSTPAGTATTSYSLIPPAGSTWTRSSWSSSRTSRHPSPRRDPADRGRHDRSGRRQRRQDL